MNYNEVTLWTALITPLNSDNTVNYDDLDLLLKAQEEAQNGVLILGSTGESLNLDLQTKKEIINYVSDKKLTVPVMAGVGGQVLTATADWVNFLNTKNIDCYLMVTPLYAKPETKGQIAWFTSLMDISTKPVMLYNVPSRTGKALSFDAVKELSNHKNYWAVKEASGSTKDFENYFNQINSSPKVYSGDDALTPDFAPLGCCGLVSVASNAWPKQTKLYVEKCLNKTLTNEEKTGWEKACDSLFEVSNPIPVKCLMHETKQISNPNLILPLAHEDLASTKKQLEAHHWVNDWYNSQN